MNKLVLIISILLSFAISTPLLAKDKGDKGSDQDGWERSYEGRSDQGREHERSSENRMKGKDMHDDAGDDAKGKKDKKSKKDKKGKKDKKNKKSKKDKKDKNEADESNDHHDDDDSKDKKDKKD